MGFNAWLLYFQYTFVKNLLIQPSISTVCKVFHDYLSEETVCFDKFSACLLILQKRGRPSIHHISCQPIRRKGSFTTHQQLNYFCQPWKWKTILKRQQVKLPQPYICLLLSNRKMTRRIIGTSKVFAIYEKNIIFLIFRSLLLKNGMKVLLISGNFF